MRKAISSSWIIFTSLYMCVGCLGYSAFGDRTPINLLTKTGVYGFFNPYWLIDAGNMFVMLRMVGAYQVSTCQPWKMRQGGQANRLTDWFVARENHSLSYAFSSSDSHQGSAFQNSLLIKQALRKPFTAHLRAFFTDSSTSCLKTWRTAAVARPLHRLNVVPNNEP